jgi:predicted lipoprotein with Yx(FWY)xxD motif
MNKRIIGVMAAVLLVSAGCGDGGTDDAAPTPSPAEATEQDDMATEAPEPSADETDLATGEAETPAATETAAEDADVQVDESSTVGIAETSLGTILVDGEGMTLYVFDSDDPGASTCYDDCAANWPPVTVDRDPVGGESIDDALLGTTERDDGSRQISRAQSAARESTVCGGSSARTAPRSASS